MVKAEKISVLIFVMVVILLANYLAGKIVGLDIRALIVVLSALVLFFPSLNYKIGMYLLLTYMIIMPFLRRLTYTYQHRIVSDPILVIPDIILILMMAGFWTFNSDYLMRFIAKDRLTKIFIIFVLLCVLMIFNPLQGGLS